MDPNFIDFLIKTTNSTACEEIEVIQSLWSGYGKISRFRLEGSEYNTVVIKFILLNKPSAHPRGWNTNNSHNRKVKSYQVETQWYEQWSKACSSNCQIPKLIGTYAQGDNQWIILEDLNTNYPLRKYDLHLEEIKVCLKWLANFHGNFLGKAPLGLWEVGTYWHLSTRPDEFEKIKNKDLKSKAHLIDKTLNECKYQTIVHGDAKLANFCFSEDGKSIAAVDFQYVGGGCGMKDVAYFLGSCLSGPDCKRYESELLAYYFQQLKVSIAFHANEVDFNDLKTEWQKMYPIACTDFNRFLLGWMPTHQKLNRYNMEIMQKVLSEI